MRTLTLDELPHVVGETFEPSPWLVVDQERIDRFGDATDDLQWIHTDPAAAASGPFGTTIAHGYLTLSLVPHLMADVVDFVCDQTLNYGIEKVRFPAPVPSGSRIRLRLTIADAQEIPSGVQLGLQAVVELEGSEKPACFAQLVYRLMD